jgi:hypothetical protein
MSILLLESGDHVLLESGDDLLLEDAPTVAPVTDPFPVTLTLRASGHTVTFRESGHTLTVKDRHG